MSVGVCGAPDQGAVVLDDDTGVSGPQVFGRGDTGSGGCSPVPPRTAVHASSQSQGQALRPLITTDSPGSRTATRPAGGVKGGFPVFWCRSRDVSVICRYVLCWPGMLAATGPPRQTLLRGLPVSFENSSGAGTEDPRSGSRTMGAVCSGDRVSSPWGEAGALGCHGWCGRATSQPEPDS